MSKARASIKIALRTYNLELLSGGPLMTMLRQYSILSICLLSTLSGASHAQAPSSGPYHEVTYDTEFVLFGRNSNPAVYDLNQDGAEDFIIHTPLNFSNDDPNGRFFIYLNENGALVNRTSELLIGNMQDFAAPRQYLFADFNNDGYTDIYLESHGLEIEFPFPGEQNRLLLSNGEGSLVVATSNLPPLVDFSHGSHIGDLDGDGDIDILVNNLGASGEALLDGEGNNIYYFALINDGTGQFTRDTEMFAHLCSEEIYGENFNTSSCQHFWTLVLDANNDGHNDVYMGESNDFGDNPNSAPGFIVLNEGGGIFGQPVPASLPESLNGGRGVPQDGFVIDINNDGLDDILVEDSDLFEATPEIDDEWTVLISNGDGTFTNETDSRIPYLPVEARDRGYREIQLGDFDEDGFVDLFFQRPASGPEDTEPAYMTVFLNDGSGYFRELDRSTFPFQPQFRFVPINLNKGDQGTDFIAYAYRDEVIPEIIKVTNSYGPFFIGDDTDNRIVGGSRDEHFEGSGGDDEIFGGNGADNLMGGSGDDILNGERGNDTLRGDGGNDYLYGGDGSDYAVYLTPSSEFAITTEESVTTVSHNLSGEVDTIRDIEFLTFSDTEIYLGTRATFSAVSNSLYIPKLDGGELGTYSVKLKLTNAETLVFELVSAEIADNSITSVGSFESGVITLPEVYYNELRYELKLEQVDGSTPVRLRVSNAAQLGH